MHRGELNLGPDIRHCVIYCTHDSPQFVQPNPGITPVGRPRSSFYKHAPTSYSSPSRQTRQPTRHNQITSTL